MSNKISFWKRLGYKYRVYFLNENTLEETLRFRLSFSTLFTTAFLLFIFTFLLTALIIFTTPIKQYLPGFADNTMRKGLIESNFLLDSLKLELNNQNKQMAQIRYAINGNFPLDSLADINDSVAMADWKQVHNIATDKEKEFVKKYEDSEHHAQVLKEPDIEIAAKATVFFPPCKGVVVRNFNPNFPAKGVDIRVDKKAYIMAISDGIVINSEYSLAHYFTIMIQHPNNFVSIYQNLSSTQVKSGDEVRGGQVIGLLELGDEDTEQLRFQMWQNAEGLNPSSYINLPAKN